jgi:hypothetical protein
VLLGMLSSLFVGVLTTTADTGVSSTIVVFTTGKYHICDCTCTTIACTCHCFMRERSQLCECIPLKWEGFGGGRGTGRLGGTNTSSSSTYISWIWTSMSDSVFATVLYLHFLACCVCCRWMRGANGWQATGSSVLPSSVPTMTVLLHCERSKTWQMWLLPTQALQC